MDPFDVFSRLLFTMTTILIMTPYATPLDCSPSSGSIKCECTTTTAECFGTQADLFEAEEILKNFTKKENVIFRINDLQFDSGFMLENSDIKNLTLGYTKYGLQVLSLNFFSKLSTTLTSLNLQNNSIIKIDDYFFANFSLLTELFIDSNDIENLTVNTFINLTNLKYLSLSYNNISEVESEVFQNLKSLETLILSYNKFSLIENLNINCTTLTELKIDNCLIEGLIHENTLANIPATEKLDISYNKLSGIKSQSLSSLKNLKYLNLSYNVIEYLEENAFSEVRNLTTLDLQDNRISVIKLSSFEKLHNLKYLDLSGNKLKAVLCEYTTDFISLERIYLQNNEIKTFTPGAFFYSPKLKIMNITGNNLECSCPLTDSALYLIENGTMESADLDSVLCIIPSTGSQMRVTEYESSKCVSVEPCKKTEIIDEEDYDYEDPTSSSTTDTFTTSRISLFTDETSFEESTTLITTTQFATEENSTTEPVITTTGYNATNIMPISANSEDTTVLTKTTKELYTESISGNSFEESNTTVSILSDMTESITATDETEIDTTMKPLTTIVHNGSNTTITSIHSEDTTVPFIKTTTELYTENVSDNITEKSNTTLSMEITTANTLSVPTTEKIVSSTTVTSKIISPYSESDCSSLQLFISNASLSSNLTIIKNFTYRNNILCLKWTLGSTDGLNNTRCSLKLVTSIGEVKFKNLKCPTSAYQVKDKVVNEEKLIRFCIIIHTKPRNKEYCTPTISGKSTTSTNIASTESAVVKSSATESTTVESTATKSTTVESTATESITLLDTTIDKVTTVLDKSTTNTTVLMSAKTNLFTTSTSVTTAIYPPDFKIMALNLYFNDSKLAFTTWAVNKWQPLSECNLTLKVSTQYFDEIEGIFPCKNNTYKLITVKQDDIFKICLFSYHAISGKDTLCQHTLPSAKAAKGKEDSLNSSLIPLICLLIFVGFIILFIVIKNISKRRTVSKKYDVRAEEEKYQERTKLRPQSVHEESVRFSYIAKENHD